MEKMEDHSLIQALQNPALYNHPIIRFEVIETHLSFILLTGHYAYKIKKAIDLKFADFSTLEKRYHYCEEELRLNRRLAPSLYLGLVAIQDPYQGESILEYAVQMKQFDQNKLLSALITKKSLSAALLQNLAKIMAEFHESISISEPESEFGSLASIKQPMLENFSDSKKILLKNSINEVENTNDAKNAQEILALLSLVEKKSIEEFSRLQDLFLQRKQNGFIRECHGDCHLGNIVLIDDKPLIFDCIEFNESFRWIDTINEIAFLTMDLQARSHSSHATYCFLNAYLEKTGDYTGLRLLRFYQIYRAMVRAKVALLTQKPDRLAEFLHYLKLSQSLFKKTTPRLIITYGVSGSGKTWIASSLAPEIPALHLRSDIERHRMKIAKAERYSSQSHKKVYQRLFELAEQLLEEGYSVIVDATFLHYQDRQAFHKLAQKLNLNFHILQCEADKEILQQRISRRITENQDASEANLEVLEKQLSIQEPLRDTEQHYRILYNPRQDMQHILNAIFPR